MDHETEIGQTVVCILAGGKGQRLMPLTEYRAKPAVPFGGKYRIIDFVLSNTVNSGFNKVYIFPQHLNQSLNEHLMGGWGIFSAERNQFLRIVSPQGRVTDSWYSGTAASVYENFHSIGQDKPKYVLILSSDQIYKMNYAELLQTHIDSEAELTIAAIPVKRTDAHRFGVLEIDQDRMLQGFEEKPSNPKPVPGRSEESLVSMGIYIFSAKALIESLSKDMAMTTSKHDFGRNIIPMMLREKSRISVFIFQDKNGEARHWIDVGTIDAFYKASMDLTSLAPRFNLYDATWPWRTFQRPIPPTRTLLHTETFGSIVSDGCIFEDCRIAQSVISPRVNVGYHTNITESIIMSGVVVGNNVRIHRAIIDKNNVIPDSAVIDAEHMNYSGEYTLSPSGIIVIPRHFPVWTGE